MKYPIERFIDDRKRKGKEIIDSCMDTIEYFIKAVNSPFSLQKCKNIREKDIVACKNGEILMQFSIG